jgi:hypothetical protein
MQGLYMSKSDIYRQCKLQKDNVIDVAFIPAALAKVGRNLRIKINGEWQDGWQVMEVWTARTFAEIDTERDARRHLEENLDPHR